MQIRLWSRGEFTRQHLEQFRISLREYFGMGTAIISLTKKLEIHVGDNRYEEFSVFGMNGLRLVFSFCEADSVLEAWVTKLPFGFYFDKIWLPIDLLYKTDNKTKQPQATTQHFCWYFECAETPIQCCDVCDRWFCEEHCGQRGGDRQVQDVGAVAYPAMCQECATKDI